MGIGERLKEERERLCLNQTEFAARAGASKNTQYNYEKGERSPDANYLIAAAGHGVDVLYVLTGERKREVSGSLTASEANVLACYRKLSPADQSVLERTAVALADMTDRQGY
ncbi:helix-turn-helix transcriptional regulator [Pseudomonas entomophila]|uniref:helix-turn-helix domain-containing protein n=1 Tax=Pseudomonas entomophila TaxID=312306 RepID=UPI0023D8AEB9|nr:helix-turn-helix transcriptional regulator [Pseudomonas entomophila]MDF0732337.1 helix-turn-helix transcriptional regulator [Pseudomonas entomophila]